MGIFNDFKWKIWNRKVNINGKDGFILNHHLEICIDEFFFEVVVFKFFFEIFIYDGMTSSSRFCHKSSKQQNSRWHLGFSESACLNYGLYIKKKFIYVYIMENNKKCIMLLYNPYFVYNLYIFLKTRHNSKLILVVFCKES